MDELGDTDVAIEKAGALVNQNPDKYMDSFSVQWLVDEDDSFLAKLDRKLKQKGQVLLTNWLEMCIRDRSTTTRVLGSAITILAQACIAE